MGQPKLYLDVCTLCRPFDDQLRLRVRLETDSYFLIMQAIRKRADEWVNVGLGIADAAHIAFAEVNADYFISCDDRLIKRSRRENADVTVMTPVEFCVQENLV